MIVRPPGPRLDGDTELRIGVNGLDGSRDADSGSCATLLAMASHDFDILAPILHGGTAQAQLGRAEYATRQLADKADGHLPAASAAGDEHATAARRVADGTIAAGSTLHPPGAGPSTQPPQRLPGGSREVAAAWLLCVFIAVLALGATSGPHNSESPAAAVANKTAIRWHMQAVCTPPLPCAEGATAILEPW
jgi:hypothetical protein